MPQRDSRSLERSAGPEQLDLVYPIYLDIPMMVSFLAPLTGGIVLEGDRTTKDAAVAEDQRGGGLRLAPVVDFLQIGLSLQSKRGTSTVEETRVRWQHTAASLLNILRDRLRNYIQRLSEDRPPEVGALIELTGQIYSNPVDIALTDLRRIDPSKADLHSENVSAFITEASHVLMTEQPLKDILERFKERKDLRQRSFVEIFDEIVDLGSRLQARLVNEHLVNAVVASRGANGLLTLWSDFITEQGRVYLEGGEFRVLGKVIGAGVFTTGHYQVTGSVAELQLWLWDALSLLHLPSVPALHGVGGDVPFVKMLPLAVFA